MRCAACKYSDEGYEGNKKATAFIPIREKLGADVVSGLGDEWVDIADSPPTLFACPACGTVKVSQDWLTR